MVAAALQMRTDTHDENNERACFSHTLYSGMSEDEMKIGLLSQAMLSPLERIKA